MIDFPNCKINLGLNVTEKRPDGYHNIETVFYPVAWCDALEILETNNNPFELTVSGLSVSGPIEQNIIYKAWLGLNAIIKTPPMAVNLHKILPMGAGLGGGSSDAAFFLKLANKKFNLGLNTKQLSEIAKTLGADCAFFIENTPVFAVGKGDEFTAIKVDLSKYYILVVHPGINSNTAEAYAGITPKKPEFSLKEIIENEPIENWKSVLFNDFEKSIFKKYPQVEELKNYLYQIGAIYSAMSGSGSAVFGVFKFKPNYQFNNKGYSYHLINPH